MLYNSTPLVLFGYKKELVSAGISTFRMMFTVEEEKQINKVFDYYENTWIEKKMDLSAALKGEYTNGHFKRGVE